MPITINSAFVETPTRVHPLRRKLMSKVPTMVPVTVPLPPERLAPPMTLTLSKIDPPLLSKADPPLFECSQN